MVQASYFDGRSTRVHAVDVTVVGEDLGIEGEALSLRVPFSQVTVDERLGRAPRRLRFADGGFCEVRDLEELDALLASIGHRDGWVDRMQRRSRPVLLSIAACVVLTAVAYRWGLPWAAAIGARHLPPGVGQALTAQSLKILDGNLLAPSTLAPERQQVLTTGFRKLRLPDGGRPDSVVLFRNSPQLGANAFTLPDGTIIMLDDLVAAIGDDQQIMAVFAHELGHAHARHGLQRLLEGSVVGALWTFYLGDISALLAAAPAAVVQAKYSQDFERAADDYGAAVLSRNGMSPVLLASALKKLVKRSVGEQVGGGYLASHPATEERMRHLQDLAGSFQAE